MLSIIIIFLTLLVFKNIIKNDAIYELQEKDFIGGKWNKWLLYILVGVISIIYLARLLI